MDSLSDSPVSRTGFIFSQRPTIDQALSHGGSVGLLSGILSPPRLSEVEGLC
jgi:hypothetical protein